MIDSPIPIRQIDNRQQNFGVRVRRARRLLVFLLSFDERVELNLSPTRCPRLRSTFLSYSFEDHSRPTLQEMRR